MGHSLMRAISLSTSCVKVPAMLEMRHCACDCFAETSPIRDKGRGVNKGRGASLCRKRICSSKFQPVV